jgi:CRP-like cAMP-binding protein
MREGEQGARFVVVESGEVEVSVDGRQVQRAGRGAGLGEIALLRRSPRTATVTALTAVTAFAIPGSCFVAAVSGPAAAAVTERIAQANLQRGATSAAT